MMTMMMMVTVTMLMMARMRSCMQLNDACLDMADDEDNSSALIPTVVH